MGIMKKQTNLTLPEWAFLDGNSHLGDTLEGRTVLQHIRSYTMLEVFSLDDLMVKMHPKIKTKVFPYKNGYGIEEKHIFVIHFSLAPDFELETILEKAVDFYCKYMQWMDKSIEQEDTSKHN